MIYNDPTTSDQKRQSPFRPGRYLAAACVVAIVTMATAKAQIQRSISGRVVDAAGKPVAGAVVCAAFPQLPGKEREPIFLQQVTGADGLFRLSWQARSVPASAKLFVTRQPHQLTDSMVVMGPSFPEVLSAADAAYAGTEVDLTHGSMSELSDVHVQVNFGLLVVRLSGAKARVDSEQPSEETGLNLRVRDSLGDVVVDQYIPSGATRDEGSAFGVYLPEGHWIIEVAKDGDNVWHSLGEMAQVQPGGESLIGLLDLSARTNQIPHLAAPVDPASVRQQLQRLRVERSEHSLLLHVWAHNDWIVPLLLRAGVNPDVKDPWTNRTLLMIAAGDGDVQMVQALLDGGADVNAAVPELGGATALQTAVLNSHDGSGVVQVLLRAGANPNVVSQRSGRTPLIYAVEASTPETVKMLLAAGADPNHVATNGVTALFMAEFLASTEAAKALRNAGAKR